jgi:hypothetical protein
MLYTALAADVINSKKLKKEEREHSQLLIRDCLVILNSLFRPSLEFEVAFSAGDEVQGLFKSPEAAYLYVRLLKLLLYPLKLRCGIGAGEWEVRIPNGTTNEQDGSAYHNARTAINAAHEKNSCSILFNSKTENDIFINTLINTSVLYSESHSPKQHQLLLLTEMTNPFYEAGMMDIAKFPELLSLAEKNLDLRIPVNFETYNVFSQAVNENRLTLAPGIMKGLSRKLSAVLNTSRQSVDKVIKSGSIAEIRYIDTAVLLLVRKTFAG